MSLYDKAVLSLYRVNMYQPVKMGLSNMTILHRFLGNPMDSVPAIHIAGTNGKGSVAFKMAKALEAAGYRTALFVSPHVSSFRERMQVNGELIPEEAVVKYLEQIFSICKEQSIPATFFELSTAMAFAYFKDSQAQVAVVEAGLGGRLDATNIIMPMLSIITSIGLEHTKILGNTIEEIATEKAGIIKTGIPVLVGKSCPAQFLQNIAISRDAPFYQTDDIPDIPTAPSLVPNDMDFDIENSYLASAALTLLSKFTSFGEISTDAIIKGVAQRPPCRFQIINVIPERGGREVKVVLDVAHNPQAMLGLKKKLLKDVQDFTPRFVIGLSNDKDASQCLATIASMFEGRCGGGVHLVEAKNPRAATAESLANILMNILPGWNWDRDAGVCVKDGVRRAIEAASVSKEPEVVVICGSVFIMADAREALGIVEPQDSKIVAELFGTGSKDGQDVISSLEDRKIL